MRIAGYFLDTNLLILLIVGGVDTCIIAKHRRLSDYTEDDYVLLLVILEEASRIFVTPNTLTEASNLLAQHGEPERSLLMAGLRYLIDESEEIVVSSALASAHPEFSRLGLTDVALLEAISLETPLITADMNLYAAALEKDENAAVNFREFMALAS